MPDGRQSSRRNRDHSAENQRRQSEIDGGWVTLDDRVQNRPLGTQRLSEIAVDQTLKPAKILRVQRPVESHLLAQKLVLGLVITLIPEHDLDRISRQEMDDGEDQKRRAQEHRHELHQASEHVENHEWLAFKVRCAAVTEPASPCRFNDLDRGRR